MWRSRVAGRDWVGITSVRNPVTPQRIGSFSCVFVRLWTEGYALMTRRATMKENELPPLNVLERKVAAEHACTRVPVAYPSVSVEQMRWSLNEGPYDSLTRVAILEGTKLVGVLTIEVLFAAPGEVTAG